MTLELSQKMLAWLFLASLIMGFTAGFAYDLLKLRRNIISFGKVWDIIVISVEDFIFFVCWSAAFCILLYAMTFGVVRVEAIFSQIAGFWIYRKTLAIPVGILTKALSRWMKRVFRSFCPKKNNQKNKYEKRKDRQK